MALAVLMAGAASAGAQPRVQRQVNSQSGQVSSGSGMKLETCQSQVASAKVTGTVHKIYTGYLNTNHAPGTVIDLTAGRGSTGASVGLTWTEPGADGPLNKATSIKIKVSTSPITSQLLFEAATTYAVLAPLNTGGFESQILGHLSPGPTYYFAVEARDAAGNQGALSNFASTTTLADPPGVTGDLAAANGAGGGTAVLTWHSAGENGDTGTLNPGQYRIVYSTDAAPSFVFNQFQLLVATIAAAGSPQNLPLSGLLGNATYTFGLFTGNSVPVFSGLSNTPQVLTFAYPPAAQAYSGISSTAFTANWGLNGNRAGTEFYVEISTSADFSPALLSPGWQASLSGGFSGLPSNATYHGRVKARNAAGFETAFVDLGALFIGQGLLPPVSPSASPRDRTLDLTWSPVLSGDPTGVRIFRGPAASGPFVLVASVPIAVTSYADGGLINGVTYYYHLRAFNGTVESADSVLFSGWPKDPLRPQGLPGVKGDIVGTDYHLSWVPNPYNDNAGPLIDLAGYNVYRTSAPFTGMPPEKLAFIPVSMGAVEYDDPQGAAVAPMWYFVRQIDTSGNESIDSPWIRSAPEKDYIWVSTDCPAYVQTPLEQSDPINRGLIVVHWKHHVEEEHGRVVASCEIKPIVSETAQAVRGAYYFQSKLTELTFNYRTPPGAGPASAPAALAPNVVFHPEDLSAYLWDGVGFVKLGGKVDTAKRTVTVKSQLFTKYIIKQTLRGQDFTFLQTSPAKIFTPNGDGFNDQFEIFFDNPNGSDISLAKVYDVTGAEVNDLQAGSTSSSLRWNGRDRSGQVARGGIYIYQIQSEGKTVNGTMVLAK